MKAKQLYLIKEGESHVRMAGKIHVRAHRRRNGSYVKGYWRRKPSKSDGTYRRLEATEMQPRLFEEVTQLSLFKDNKA